MLGLKQMTSQQTILRMSFLKDLLFYAKVKTQ